MGVKRHGRTYDVGHFMKTAVILGEEGVQNTTLHRFEPVIQMRHRPVKNHITGVIEKPIAVGPLQRCFRRGFLFV